MPFHLLPGQTSRLLGVASSNILALDPPDRHIVGMWETSMIYDLAWQRIHGVPSSAASQNHEIQVPSWSWASFGGEILFPQILPGRNPSFFATLVDIVAPDWYSGVDQAPERGASLQLECFLFAINLLWSDYDEVNGIVLNQFNMVFMQEYAGLETNFGTVIDLDEDDPSVPRGKTLQMLAQEGKLFLVPLYATLYLRAMSVARLGNTSQTYCRLGAFEVALGLQGFPRGEEWQTSKERGWNAGLQAVRLQSFMDNTPRVLGEDSNYCRIEII